MSPISALSSAAAVALETLPQTPSRKNDHLRIAADERSLHHGTSGLERYRLTHRALPERDLTSVDLTTELLGSTLQAPIIISAMTGGTSAAALINERLAEAAQVHGIALALGSGRALLRDESLLVTYRSAARPPLVLANLGAAQLLAPTGLDDAERLVTLLGAHSLAIHCNPLQEAVQPEGQAVFAGLSARIAELCRRLSPLPIVVKEVGFGMSGADVDLLIAAGVAAIDVAGSGGTNWALVEGQRDRLAGEVAAAFSDWGVPTADALAGAVERCGDRLPVIASGGLRNGVDAATALALGATAAGFARELLLAAQDDRAEEAVAVLVRQLQIATWLTGAASTGDLGSAYLQPVTA